MTTDPLSPPVALTIPGYSLTQLLHEGERTVVYRAIRLKDEQSIVIKLLKSSYPNILDITRLKQEYKIQSSINVQGIVKPYGLESHNNRLALILEDFGGISLKSYAGNTPLAIKVFLPIAIQVVQTLDRLHQHQIIHKDIKPQNIIINPHTLEVKIIDFSIASQLSRETLQSINPELLEGTLAYISPEQTGRMNRAIDYRTDFYALGVTFYELLTSQLPFQNTDALELIHSHIALQPLLPHQLNPDIPLSLSRIVMRLMAKTVEERYQTAIGLEADLQYCWEQWQTNQQIPDFVPGQTDLSAQLYIPEKLYGRQQEVQTLLDAFEHASTGTPEWILVSGYSGIGKSSVVQEIHKPIVQKRGYFISGKFDQFKQHIPYTAITQAFQDLIRQLLAEPEAKLQKWQQKLFTALGSSAQVIIDVLPDLEIVLGPQPTVIALGPTEAQNRFNRLFQKLMSVFAQAEHPLVVFLDDLQWADIASLKLIQQLISNSETKYLLLIGAYRDHEVNATHPLMQILDEVEQAEVKINNIVLQPLDLQHTHHLIVDTVKDKERSFALAQLLHNKTQGNPFYLIQMLKTLYQEGLLQFDFKLKQWVWNITQIQSAGVVNLDVVELLANNLHKLPTGTKETLKLAACIGNRFSLETLETIQTEYQFFLTEEHSTNSTLFKYAENLWPALQAGFIVPVDREYRVPLFLQVEDVEGLQLGETRIEYKFLHDRVQQAAYSLIPESQKAATHLKIGQLLRQSIGNDKLEENVFDIVNQLNLGRQLIELHSERNDLAYLNLIAGKKAKDSAAFAAATQYLDIGLSLLAPDCWTSNYDLTLSLHTEAAEAEYLNARGDRSKQLVDAILSYAQNTLDKVRAYQIQIASYIIQQKYNDSVAAGLAGLRMLGVNLPERPIPIRVMLGFLQTKILMGKRQVEELATLPAMSDVHKLAIMQLLGNTIFPTYVSGRMELLALIIFELFKLSLKYGNSSASILGYVMYGFSLCNFGDIELGYRFGRLSQSLKNDFPPDMLMVRGLFLFEVMVRHWKEHCRESLNPLLELSNLSYEIGTLDYVGHSLCFYSLYQFCVGESLEDFIPSSEAKVALFRNLQQKLNLFVHQAWLQLALNLTGRSSDLLQFAGPAFYENTDAVTLDPQKHITEFCNLYLARLMNTFLFKDYSSAQVYVQKITAIEVGTVGFILMPMIKFYRCLTLLALYPKASPTEQRQYWQSIQADRKQLEKWAHHSCSNYQSKYLLVEAEIARVQKKDQLAANFYDLAIENAEKNNFIRHIALANELAGEYYLSIGRFKVAKTYLTEAYYAYVRWGALGKVQHLEQCYPNAIIRIENSIHNHNLPTSTTTTATTTLSQRSRLDSASIVKASQAIASEIVLNTLLEKLLKIVMENAGAEKGVLLLTKENKLFIEAIGRGKYAAIQTMQSLPLENSQELPISLVNYVARSKQSIVLHDAVREGQFINDPYIQASQTKSILCTPLLSQGNLTGILYLDNSLVTDVFTLNRVEILNMLSAQAVISIENARLYTNMAALNQAYERFVPRQFLQYLGKSSITDVELGDQVEREMSVLFSDIRDFTSLSESMTTEENFRFINSYLSRMGPVIANHKGFIDKYVGDGIMALFSGKADDAVQASIAMLHTLTEYNQFRRNKVYRPIQIGIGINTGNLMLGTVGEHNRMDGTVISDAVNLASRIEALTKAYGVALLISEHTLTRLENPQAYNIRLVDRVQVKGKSTAVTVYEVFDADPEVLREAKLSTKECFDSALNLYNAQQFEEASLQFMKVITVNPHDPVAHIYLNRCHQQTYKLSP